MEDGRTGRPQTNVDTSVSRRTSCERQGEDSWSGARRRRTRWKTGTLEEGGSDEMSLSPVEECVSQLSCTGDVTSVGDAE